MGRFGVTGLFFMVAILMLVSLTRAEQTISLNAVPLSGKAPLEVSFGLVSSEEVLAVSWDFEGDGKEDSTELSPKYVYGAGKYTGSAKVTTASGSSILSAIIVVDEPFDVSIIAAPSAGVAPLTVDFTSVVTGNGGPFTYAWDFNGDLDLDQGTGIDSTEQNPSFTFEKIGEIIVTLIVTDLKSSHTANLVIKNTTLKVSSYDSKIKIDSYFPTSLELKENQVTFLVVNQGSETIKDISAKMIGEGIQHLSSTAISHLKPGEQDSLTVKMNILKEGNLAASVKIDEKFFPVIFTVAEQVKINKEELELELAKLKLQLQEQEDLYYQKKAEEYLVDEVFDNIKDTKKQLQDAQQQILTGKLEEASINVDLAAPAIEDIKYRLGDAQKPKRTALLWLKENAIAITAIIAAVGTLSGLAVKVSKGARKLGGEVKGKFTRKDKEEKGKADLPEADDEPKKEKEDNGGDEEKEEQQEDKSIENKEHS